MLQAFWSGQVAKAEATHLEPRDRELFRHRWLIYQSPEADQPVELFAFPLFGSVLSQGSTTR